MFRIPRTSPASPELKLEPYFRWEDPHRRIRVDLSLEVVEELRAAIEATSAGTGDRGSEIGGLLLGRRGDPVRIQAFQTIESEHRRGPSYTVGAKERKVFAKCIEKMRGYDVVGYFRSHTRTGLYLDQEDFALMQTFFPDPSQVALIVKPWAGHGQIAGFFFWEEGDIYRRATYHQFPFEPSELGPEHASDTEVPALADLPPAADRPPPVPVRNPIVARTFLRRPRPRAAALIGAAALGVVALGLSAVTLLPLGKDKAAPPRTSGNDIALSVTRFHNGLRVAWNQDSGTLATARGATLRIDDGGHERIVALDERQIRMGSITYFPATDSVTVRLDPGIQVASSAPVEPPIALEEPKPPVRRAVPAQNLRKPAPRRFLPVGLLAGHVESADRVELEPPPQLSPSLLPKSEAMLIPPKKTLPPTVARVSYEPVQPHALRKVVNKIPGLRLLQKRQYRDAADFRAPKAVNTAPPAIPSGVAAQGSLVELKILIDKAGEVQRAEVVSKHSNDRLEDMALNSVKDWKFAPARLEQELVESEMIVHFNFDPVASSARASRR
jgi:TonB family protein